MKNSAEAQVPLSIMAAVNHGRETVLTKCQHTLRRGNVEEDKFQGHESCSRRFLTEPPSPRPRPCTLAPFSFSPIT